MAETKEKRRVVTTVALMADVLVGYWASKWVFLSAGKWVGL